MKRGSVSNLDEMMIHHLDLGKLGEGFKLYGKTRSIEFRELDQP